MSEPIRLAKLIAQRGVASRRRAEALIDQGLVKVDGQVVTQQGAHVDPARAKVTVDGQPLPPPPRLVWYAMYKPRGCITGRDDPQGRKSVFDVVGDLPERVEPVGRLDFDTEGLLLLTNDGEMAHKLLHPSRHVPKRYLAKTYRTPTAAQLRLIERGRVFLDDGAAAPAKVRVVDATGQDNAWVEITVHEGRNRLIRRLFAQLGHPVSKLRRESFGTVSLRGLERGQFRPLTPDEIRRLHDLAEGRAPSRAGRVKKRKGFAKAKPRKKRLGGGARRYK